MKTIVACVVLCLGCGSVTVSSSLLAGDGAVPIPEAGDPLPGDGPPGGNDGGLTGDVGPEAGALDALPDHEVDAVIANADGGDGLDDIAQSSAHPASGPWTMSWEGGGCIGTMNLKAEGGGGDWSLYGPFMCNSEFEGSYSGTVGGAQHGNAVTLNIHGVAITAAFSESIDVMEGTAKADGGVVLFHAHR